MSSVPLMALRNSERRSDEALDSDQISDEEDAPLESVLANMKYRYGNRNKYKQVHFDVLLTVRLSIFISVINQLHAQIFFTVKFISCLYMFRAHVLIIRRSTLHYTAFGIIIPIDLFHASTCFEHMCSLSGGQICITQPLISSHL